MPEFESLFWREIGKIVDGKIAEPEHPAEKIVAVGTRLLAGEKSRTIRLQNSESATLTCDRTSIQDYLQADSSYADNDFNFAIWLKSTSGHSQDHRVYLFRGPEVFKEKPFQKNRQRVAVEQDEYIGLLTKINQELVKQSGKTAK